MCIKVWQGSNQTGQVMVACRWNRVIKPNFVSDLLSGLTALDYYFELHAVHCDIVHYITVGLRVLRFCRIEPLVKGVSLDLYLLPILFQCMGVRHS